MFLFLLYHYIFFNLTLNRVAFSGMIPQILMSGSRGSDNGSKLEKSNLQAS